MDVVNDIELKQREERRQVREDAELFAGLIAHKGWPRFIALIDAVAQNHHAAVMKPLENVLESTKVEFAKGVLSGLSLAATLPHMKMREALELRPADSDEE